MKIGQGYRTIESSGKGKIETHNGGVEAAVKAKGTIFEIIYRLLVLRLGHKQTIGAIAHRLCRLIWIICIGEWPMKSEALPSTNDHDSNAPKECFENCAS